VIGSLPNLPAWVSDRGPSRIERGSIRRRTPWTRSRSPSSLRSSARDRRDRTRRAADGLSWNGTCRSDPAMPVRPAAVRPGGVQSGPNNLRICG